MTVQEMPRRQTTPLIRGTKQFVHGDEIFHASTSPINSLIFSNLYIFETDLTAGKRPLGRERGVDNMKNGLNKIEPTNEKCITNGDEKTNTKRRSEKLTGKEHL